MAPQYLGSVSSTPTVTRPLLDSLLENGSAIIKRAAQNATNSQDKGDKADQFVDKHITPIYKWIGIAFAIIVLVIVSFSIISAILGGVVFLFEKYGCCCSWNGIRKWRKTRRQGKEGRVGSLELQSREVRVPQVRRQ